MSAHCPICKSAPGELVAREPWPPQLDVTRCEQCRAALSYRWPIADGVFERRVIARG